MKTRKFTPANLSPFTVLRQLKSVWERKEDLNDACMLWAASCLCFFGFLRMGQVVVPSNSSYGPEVHLSVGDIKVNDRKKPSFLEVRIKASKTDVFRRGVTIYLGVTGVDICPVAAILSYMIHCSVMARGKQSSFFCFSNGRALTRDCFVQELRVAISAGGIDASAYTGHSFRIDAATTAAVCGLPESLIKTLGIDGKFSIIYSTYEPCSQLQPYMCSCTKIGSGTRVGGW